VTISEQPHTVVFLTGWPFASSADSLHIVDLEGFKPLAVLLQREELELVEVRDLNADGSRSWWALRVYRKSGATIY